MLRSCSIILLVLAAPFAIADRVTPTDEVVNWVNVRDAVSNGPTDWPT